MAGAPQGYIGRNPADGRTTINRQTFNVTTGVQTSFTFTSGYDLGYLEVYLNGIKQSETTDYTAADGSTFSFAVSTPTVQGDTIEAIAYKSFNTTDVTGSVRDFAVGRNLDVTGNVTIGSSLTIASDLVVNGSYTYVNTEILDIEDKTVGIASTSAASNTTADGAGIIVYGGSDGDKSLLWDKDLSNWVLSGGGISLGTGVTISTPATNVLAFSIDGAVNAKLNNYGAFIVGDGVDGEAWGNDYKTVQAGTGAFGGNPPAASAASYWTNNAYYDAVNSRWEYIAADEASRFAQGDGSLAYYNAGSGSADGAITWTERFRVDASGNLSLAGDGNTYIGHPTTDVLAVTTAGSERVRVDASGRLLLGTTASRSIADGTPNLQVEGTAGTASLGLVRNQNNAGGSNLSFAKSRSGSLAGNTIVQDDDTLGNINFAGADGTDINTVAASIVAAVDGTPGANDMPGRLVFNTTADGANSVTERMRITAAGDVGIGTIAPTHTGAGATTGNTATLAVGIVTCTTITANKFYGDGSSLSNVTSTTINNNADNRVITGSGTANTLNGEASLTFDAGLLKIDDLSGTAGKGRLEFGNSGEQYIEGYDTGNAGSGSYMAFGDGGAEYVRITSAGNVGIGLTNAAQKLDVAGTIQSTVGLRIAGHPVAGYTSWAGSYATELGSTGTSTLRYTQLYGGGSLVATLDGNTGKVGIGCTVPGQLLEINGASNPCVLVKDTTNDCISYLYSQDSVATVGSASDHDLVFNVNNGEKMRLMSNANARLGIGTASMGFNGVYVNSTSNTDCRVGFYTPTVWGQIGYYGLSNDMGIDFSNGFQMRDAKDSYATRLQINSVGHIGMGAGESLASASEGFCRVIQGDKTNTDTGLNIHTNGGSGGSGDQYSIRITGTSLNGCKRYGVYGDLVQQYTQNVTGCYFKSTGTYSEIYGGIFVADGNNMGSGGDGIFGVIAKTENDSSGTSNARPATTIWANNANTAASTAYGVLINTVSGPGTVWGIYYKHAGSVVFRINGVGDVWSSSNSYTSDRDLKDNITNLASGSLALVKQLTPRTFNWKEVKKTDDEGNEYTIQEGSSHVLTGLIAQEVKAVIPGLVTGTDGQLDMGVNYNGLAVHLVNAVKELSAENDALKARVTALESA